MQILGSLRTSVTARDLLILLARGHGSLLILAVQGGRHFEAATLDLLIGEPFGDELIMNHLHEVAVGSRPSVVIRDLRKFR